MEIERVQISNFKGITNVELCPKKINIIVGKNNTGKTSILEAIYHALEADTEEIEEHYEPYLSSIINVNAKESKILLHMGSENRYLLLSRAEIKGIITEFKQDMIERLKTIISFMPKNTTLSGKAEEILDKLLSEEKTLSIIRDESLVIETQGQKKTLFSYTTRLFKQIEPFIEHLYEEILHRKLGQGILQRMLAQPSIFEIKHPKKKTSIFIRNLILSDRILEFSEIRADKSKLNKIQEYLQDRKILDNLERFDFDTLLFKEGTKVYEIPYDFMGDGLKALIGLIARTSPEQKIIFIEEPETWMHPGYAKELMRQIIDFSKTNNSQFFITTHSADILDIVTTDRLDQNYQEYLAKELNIVKLDFLGKNIVAEEMDQKRAKNETEDLLLDLRGI